MTITQCGPRCDVCGDYILLDASINPFSCKGIEQELHAHDECAKKVNDAFAALDWKLLPAGPLRMVFEDQEKARAAGVVK
jgi:hypothetical protein